MNKEIKKITSMRQQYQWSLKAVKARILGANAKRRSAKTVIVDLRDSDEEKELKKVIKRLEKEQTKLDDHAQHMNKMFNDYLACTNAMHVQHEREWEQVYDNAGKAMFDKLCELMPDMDWPEDIQERLAECFKITGDLQEGVNQFLKSQEEANKDLPEDQRIPLPEIGKQTTAIKQNMNAQIKLAGLLRENGLNVKESSQKSNELLTETKQITQNIRDTDARQNNECKMHDQNFNTKWGAEYKAASSIGPPNPPPPAEHPAPSAPVHDNNLAATQSPGPSSGPK